MLRYIIITSIVLFAINVNGQTTLYSADFESPFVDWSISGDLAPNQWKKSSCPGNGPSGVGVTAFHISEGGVGLGCGVGNQDQYSYTNSTSGVKQAIAYTTIVGNCAMNLQATFDYRIQGVLSQDFAELIYSTNGGATWIPVGANFTISSAWTTTTISLPVGLNFSTFLLGVGFTYDNNVINGFPLAIDNFKVTGTDTVNPTISCPSNISTCNPVVTYLDPTFGDNCFAFLTQTDGTGYSSGDVFPVGITTLSYTVEDSSANSQTCSFQIEVLDFPSAATILVDSISLCDITSAVVEAIPTTSGTGEWTLLSGQGIFNNQFSNLTGVNNLGYGTNVFVWTISSLSCGSTSDTISVIVSHTPLTASTLDTVYACNSFSVDLIANVPLYGIGTWITDLGATISDVNSATAAASNLGAGWNQFIWLIANGVCSSTSDTMHVYSAPKSAINEQDTTICVENQLFSLNGTIPEIDQTATWAFISGLGQLSSINSPTTTVENLGIGTNILVYKLDHELCNSTADTITIVTSLCDGFNPIFPTLITPNLDGKNDLFVINYLEKVYPTCRVIIFNRWGSIIFESIGYDDPWDGTFNGEVLPMGTYFYKIELNDEASTVYNGPISIIH